MYKYIEVCARKTLCNEQSLIQLCICGIYMIYISVRCRHDRRPAVRAKEAKQWESGREQQATHHHFNSFQFNFRVQLNRLGSISILCGCVLCWIFRLIANRYFSLHSQIRSFMYKHYITHTRTHTTHFVHHAKWLFCPFLSPARIFVVVHFARSFVRSFSILFSIWCK